VPVVGQGDLVFVSKIARGKNVAALFRFSRKDLNSIIRAGIFAPLYREGNYSVPWYRQRRGKRAVTSCFVGKCFILGVERPGGRAWRINPIDKLV